MLLDKKGANVSKRGTTTCEKEDDTDNSEDLHVDV